MTNPALSGPPDLSGSFSRDAVICECGDHGFVGLTRGLVAFFSPEDLDVVAGRKWYAHVCPGGVYAKAWRAKSDGPGPKKIALHRLIMGSDAPSLDHRDRDSLNNRRSNLRECSAAENTRNKRGGPRREAGFRGVSRNRDSSFRACISSDRERIHLGCFSTAQEAARAYDAAALKHHGAFALTNVALGLLAGEGT